MQPSQEHMGQGMHGLQKTDEPQSAEVLPCTFCVSELGTDSVH